MTIHEELLLKLDSLPLWEDVGTKKDYFYYADYQIASASETIDESVALIKKQDVEIGRLKEYVLYLEDAI